MCFKVRVTLTLLFAMINNDVAENSLQRFTLERSAAVLKTSADSTAEGRGRTNEQPMGCQLDLGVNRNSAPDFGSELTSSGVYIDRTNTWAWRCAWHQVSKQWKVNELLITIKHRQSDCDGDHWAFSENAGATEVRSGYFVCITVVCLSLCRQKILAAAVWMSKWIW